MRKPEVLAAIGMSNTWLYYQIKKGKFPRPIKLGENAVGWKSSDIFHWLELQLKERQSRVYAEW